MKKVFTIVSAILMSSVTFAQPCSELFFSEYLEGSSNNKALEIYNPTSTPINLSGYQVQLYSNGSATATTTLNLTGTIGAGGTFVIVNPSSNDSIKARRDTTSAVANFNGDDAIALVKSSVLLDVIGVIGTDPGTKWDVGTGSTLDYTLVRADTVREGTSNWALSATQWLVLPKDTFQFLGNHIMQSCGAITDTLVKFSPNSESISESAGAYNINLQLNAASTSTTFTVDVVLTGGTGTADDISNFSSQTVTFTPGSSSQTLPITINDDSNAEGAETFVFTLRNPSAPLLLGNDSVFTLTILPSDNPVQTTTIGQIATLDTAGLSILSGQQVLTSGTVYGVNMRATGLQFTIRDATGGVQVFAATNNFGYTVNEGDSVAVSGQVSFFRGMIQLDFLDTVYVIGTGTIKQAVQVQSLDESTESDLVRLNNMRIVNPSAWTPTGNPSGFVVRITDGVDTFDLRIDEQVNLFNDPVPSGAFDVIGIGGQFDASSPYTSGYQLFPRYRQDIILINSINEATEQHLSVYPNPATSYVLVSTPAAINGKITVYDLSGRAVTEQTTSGNTTRINTHNFVKGLYIVQFSSETFSSTTKLAVE